MNGREKILAIATASLLGLVLVSLLAMKLILEPTADARKKAFQSALDVDKLERQVRMEGDHRANLRNWTLASFGDDPSTASELCRAHLVRIVGRSGLASEDLSLTPVAGRSVKGGREIGWNVRVKGSQEKLTNLLFLMDADPHLHKLDNMAWSPIANSTDMTLSLRYTTLVLDPVEGERAMPIEPDKVQIAAGVEKSEDRLAFNVIPQRDIFRPYIKRPPPPPPPPPTRTTRVEEPPRTTTTPPPPAPTYQLVGLPTWNDQVEIVVKDVKTLKSTIYKVGEDFMGGEIVMVDYRPLPLVKKPEIISSSRVIVLIGREFFALELGHYVSEKYLMARDRLPAELVAQIPVLVPAPAPAAPETPKTATEAADVAKPAAPKPSDASPADAGSKPDSQAQSKSAVETKPKSDAEIKSKPDGDSSLKPPADVSAAGKAVPSSEPAAKEVDHAP